MLLLLLPEECLPWLDDESAFSLPGAEVEAAPVGQRSGSAGGPLWW